MNLGCIIYKLPELGSIESGIINSRLFRQIADVIDDNIGDDLTIVTGLNAGPDNMIAWSAITNQLPIIVILPYPDYTMGWDENDKETFGEIVGHSKTTVEYIHSTSMFRKDKESSRNRRIIDLSHTVILHGESPHILEAYSYAHMKGKEIITLKSSKNEKGASPVY